MRELNDQDRVLLVTIPAGDPEFVDARQDNLRPAEGETDGGFIVVVQEDARTTRAVAAGWQEIGIEEGTVYFRRQVVLGFVRTWQLGKEFVAERNKRLRATQVIPEGGAVASIQQSLRTGSTVSAQVARAKLQNIWNNCGRTAANLNAELKALGGMKTLRTDDRHVAETMVTLIEQVTGYASDGHAYVLDFSFEGVHTFTVEIQPVGCYLVQGYQAGYSAFWWQGLAEHPLALPGARVDASQWPNQWELFGPLTMKLREEYGRARLLRAADVVGLIKNIADMFALSHDGRWTEPAYKVFVTLPFYPGQGELDLTGVGDFEKGKREKMGESTRPSEPKPMVLIVNSHQIIEPKVAFGKLPDLPSDSLCHRVLASVAARLNPAK